MACYSNGTETEPSSGRDPISTVSPWRSDAVFSGFITFVWPARCCLWIPVYAKPSPRASRCFVQQCQIILEDRPSLQIPLAFLFLCFLICPFTCWAYPQRALSASLPSNACDPPLSPSSPEVALPDPKPVGRKLRRP
jgi:hypothetical protein